MKQEHFEILMEEMSSKFNLVIEGHQTLQREISETRTELKTDIELCNFKIDTLNAKIDGVAADLKATDERLTFEINSLGNNLTQKIDSVAADLKAHRQDTELHHGMYKVRE